MSLFQNQIIRAFTMTKHKAQKEEDMIRLKKVKKLLKSKHQKMKKNLKKINKIDE